MVRALKMDFAENEPWTGIIERFLRRMSLGVDSKKVGECDAWDRDKSDFKTECRAMARK